MNEKAPHEELKAILMAEIKNQCKKRRNSKGNKYAWGHTSHIEDTNICSKKGKKEE